MGLCWYFSVTSVSNLSSPKEKLSRKSFFYEKCLELNLQTVKISLILEENFVRRSNKSSIGFMIDHNQEEKKNLEVQS
jgi:hypothetical protein